MSAELLGFPGPWLQSSALLKVQVLVMEPLSDSQLSAPALAKVEKPVATAVVKTRATKPRIFISFTYKFGSWESKLRYALSMDHANKFIELNQVDAK